MLICRSCCGLATSFSGTVFGCNSTHNAAGDTVVIADLTPTTLWTGTTNSSGVYSGTITLAANTAVTITVTPLLARQTSVAISPTLTAGGTNTGLNLTLGVAAGYVCTTSCTIPVSTTWTFTGGAACAGLTFPNDTLTYATTNTIGGSAALGAGWKGTDITYAGFFGAGIYTYFFPTAPNVASKQYYRTTVPGVPINLALAGNGAATLVCGPPMVLTFTCAGGSNMNSVVAE